MRYLTADALRTNADYARRFLSGDKRREAHEGLAISILNTHHDRRWASRAETKVLDCGTSGGTFLSELWAAGYRNIYATDFDDYRGQTVKEFAKDFRTTDLNFNPLPWHDGFFQIATAWCVLPHLENPFHAAREIYRVLAPGGLFIFSTLHLSAKHSRSYFAAHGDFRSFREANNHIAVLPPGVLAKTIFSQFKLVGTEFHVHNAVFEGRGGTIRALAWKIAGLHPRSHRALANRWAYHVIYIAEKASLPATATGPAAPGRA